MNDDSACPRCGGAFHCGVNDATPCACTTICLDEALLAQLRQDYAGCLCLACLRELSAAQRSTDTSSPASAQAPISGTTPSL